MNFIYLLRLSFVILLLLSGHAYSKNNQGIIVSEITSIYDGDTFRVNIDGYPSLIGDNMPIRINGIDTPEIRTKCLSEKALAKKAKQFTVYHLRKAKVIELKNMARGKYFRIVSDVYVDGISLGQLLIDNNHAVAYSGKTKKHDWCQTSY